jgi:hypothetical protein
MTSITSRTTFVDCQSSLENNPVQRFIDWLIGQTKDQTQKEFNDLWVELSAGATAQLLRGKFHRVPLFINPFITGLWQVS